MSWRRDYSSASPSGRRKHSRASSPISLSDDEEHSYHSYKSKSSKSKGGKPSRQRRRNRRKENHQASSPATKRKRENDANVQHESHQFAYSTVYNLATRLPSFGEHTINSQRPDFTSSYSSSYTSTPKQDQKVEPSAQDAKKETKSIQVTDEDTMNGRHTASSTSTCSKQVDQQVEPSLQESIGDNDSLQVSEPSFLREFEDRRIIQSKSSALLYVLNVIRDLLKNTRNTDLALELENHCKIQLPFDVAQEFAKIEFNIAKKPYLADPQKYARLEKNMPVKSFLWIVRDLAHHGRDHDLFAEDIVQVLMSRKAIFHKLIPKILRWADNQLRPRFETEIGLHLDILGKHFRKLDDDANVEFISDLQRSAYSSSKISLIVKCERLPYGQRIQQFKGSNFDQFKTLLSEATNIDKEKMHLYRLIDSQKYAILDFSDIEDGMICVVSESITTEHAEPTAEYNRLEQEDQ